VPPRWSGRRATSCRTTGAGCKRPSGRHRAAPTTCPRSAARCRGWTGRGAVGERCRARRPRRRGHRWVDCGRRAAVGHRRARRVNAALLPCRWRAWSRAFPAAHPSARPCSAAPASVRRSRTCGSARIRGTSHARTSATRSVDRRGASPDGGRHGDRAPWTSVEDIRRLAGRLSGRDVPKLERYADDLGRVVAATGRSTAAALRAIRTGVGLGDTMDVLDSSRREPTARRTPTISRRSSR